MAPNNSSKFKFYSGILAERIKKILPKLVHLDQKGFISDRFIGKNTRLTFDIINECKIQKQKGLIILIDFEKAFDSITWNFIVNSMQLLTFEEDTIKWVKSLQLGSNSKILQNGNLSEKITLGRGCRQGDPISPYLFILTSEFLAEAIRSNPDIKGLTFFEKEHTISQYADDTTLFIKPEEKCIRSCMVTLNEFEKISGLKVNTDTTKVVKLGDWGDSRTNLCNDLKLIWTDEFISLGIKYNVNDMENITEMNIAIKKKEMYRLINTWNTRNITPLGKITLIKCLLISKIPHVLLSLPTPSNETFDELEKMFKNFIWNGKNPKFRKEILETTISTGGLKLTNLRIFDQALKISWLKRLKNKEDGWEEFPQIYKIHNLILFGDKYAEKINKKIKNKFWADITTACQNIQNKLALNNTWASNIPLWYNSRINLEYRHSWFNQGIVWVTDILDYRGDIFSKQELREKGFNINFLEYANLKFNIQNLDMKKKDIACFGPNIPYLLFKIGYNVKGCSKIYHILMNFNDNILLDVKTKWERILNEEIPYTMVKNSFINIPKMNEGPYNRYIHFKLLHRRIATNKLLFEMNIKQDNLCPYCTNTVETVEHAFLECIYVRTFWRDIENWLKRSIDNTIKIVEMEKIFCPKNPKDIIYKVINTAKIVIYRNRQTGKNYNLNDLKNILKNQMLLEEYFANVNNLENEFLNTWDKIYPFI